MPREKSDKLIFERENKEKADKEAKLAADRAEKDKELAKNNKVFGHLSGARKGPTPAKAAASSSDSGKEERW